MGRDCHDALTLTESGAQVFPAAYLDSREQGPRRRRGSPLDGATDEPVAQHEDGPVLDDPARVGWQRPLAEELGQPAGEVSEIVRREPVSRVTDERRVRPRQALHQR